MARSVGDDEVVDLGVNVGINADDLERELRAAFQSILGNMSKEFDKLLRNFSKNAGKNFKQNLGSAETVADALTRKVEGLSREMRTLREGAAAAGSSIGGAFDPKSLDPFTDALARLLLVQDKISRGVGDPKRNNQELRAALASLVSTRKLAQEVTVDQRQQARERIQQSRAQTSRYVVDQQRQASAARDASRRAIEATRAQARQRVAIIQAAARTMATIERGLGNVFQSTANVLSNGLRGLSGVATSAVNGVAGAFRKGNTEITNNTKNSLSQVSNSYSTSMRNATNTVRNETRQQASVINNFAREAKSSLGTIGSGASFGIGAAIGGILGVGAAQAVRGGFQRASTIETAEIALTKLIGSAEEAKALLTEVTEVVTGTPFALDQFASATTKLLAYNIEAKKIPEILRAAGDAAAIAGPNAAQAIDSILTSIGQINTVGRASLEEVKVIAEAGVPAFKILGNALGVTTEELRDMFEKGLVPAGVAIDALTKGILEGTDGVNGATAAFGGLAKGLGDTLAGSVSNFNTSIKRLGAGVITAFQKPFTAAMAAATAAVDLFGSALKILAQQVAASPTFQLIQQGLIGLTRALKEAKEELAPFFEFISGGIVVLGQAALALFAFKSIPTALKAVGTAIKFILAPKRLLVAGLILAASYFKKLYDESQGLRDALGKLVASVQRIATVIRDLVVDAFKSFSGATDEAAGATIGFGQEVLDVLIPAVEKFAEFLLNTVLPAVRDFAKFVREEVLPVVGKALSKAVEIAGDALESLASFIKETLIPTVGPILKRAVEIGTSAFEAAYDFLANTFVPFLRDNLTPILAGVGVALGALALTGGNIPLAGLAGLTAGIAVALSDEDIRNALVENISEAFEKVREEAKEIFTGDTILAIVKGAAAVANKIGKVIGDVITDPRLWTAAGAIAAAGAFVAVSFVAGFIEGIINNIPEIISALSKGLQAAFKALAKEPQLAALLVGILASAAVIASVAKAGQKIGRTFGESLGRGITQADFVGAKGNFFTSLFGGRAAIDRQIKEEYTRQRRVITREKQRLQRFAQQATGDVIRGPGGTFADAQQVATGVQQLEERIGRANTAAIKLRQGFADLGTGFRNFRSSSYLVTDGLRSIGEGLKAAGPSIATAAGAFAGGAFAASFVSQALLDINSSGVDKLQSAVGLAASAITTGAIIGGAAGAAAGVGVASIGLLSSAFARSKQRADALKESVKQLAEELVNLDPEAAGEVIDQTVLDRFLNASTQIKETLIDLGIGYEEFAEATSKGQGVEFLASEFEKLGPAGQDFADALRDGEITLGRIDDVISGRQLVNGLDLGALQGEIKDTGVSVEEFERTFGFLGETTKVVAFGMDDARNRMRIMGTEMGEAQQRAAGLRREWEISKGSAEVAAAAADAYKSKLEELNQQRIDGLRDKVNEAKGALDNAGAAADAAKEKLRQFLSGENVITTAKQEADNAIIAVGNLASAAASIDFGKPTTAAAELATKVAEVQGQAGGILVTAQPTDAAAAAAAVQPLKDAIGEQDISGELKAQLIAGVDAAVANYNTTEGQSLLTGLLGAETLEADLKTVLETAVRNLEVGETLPATLFTLIVTEAETAFKEAGEASSAGWVEGLDTEAMKTKAKEAADAALAATEEALGIDSPSEEFRKLGAFSAEGFALGLKGAAAQMFTAGQSIGRQAMAGLTAGLLQGSVVVFAVARSIANGIAAIMRSALLINSPSKVMEGVGISIGEGIAKGIEETAQLSADAATATMDGVLNAASAAVGSGATINSNIIASTAAVAVPAAGGLNESDIVRIGQVIADRAKPNVQIDQTFNQPVDSRAVATDVAWRLTA